ncbi:LuxR C-terminal-related transcriptional regulator [Streptomyces antarcticus]|uniref:LuxR C-terminal-related transcriptional regulator n=1 Tax=Streptomyces antarcticus TaxID=2996458 RepID=UPI00226DC131|nr:MULTISPECIES: LuxR C-terminal-related transcriptional regulator [unclassified Streptomyces]MCY0941899.1 LuxR C-terminal-related transcriptional regulator [Streptomyces sp. H34-AA3]MCZ4082828.1 LuxR C-terminal-related transcriptional regulator [Streptomyces sp. H34-S5]
MNMDTTGTSPHLRNEGDFALLADSMTLAARLLHGASVPEETPGLAELVQVGIAVREDFSGLFVLSDVTHGRRRAHAEERAGILRHLVRMQQIDSVFESLERTTVLGTSGVEFMDNMKAASAVLQKALESATSWVWTAQPLARNNAHLRVTIERDLNLLRKGIATRTIYQDSARGRTWEREYVKEVSEAGAEVRTLASDFIRIVLVDGKLAMISDYRETPQDKHKGYKVTHPGILALIQTVYNQQWDRAAPWSGEFGRPDETTRTNARQRSILRKLEDGKTLQQIASALGVSLTTVNGDVKELYRVTGATNHFGLGIWWANSPERRLT